MKNSKLVAISEFKPENLKLKDIRFLPPNIIEPRDLKGSKFVQNSIEEVKVNSNVFNYLTPSMIGIQLTIVENNLKKLEEELPSEQFMRVHRSYIISLEKIEAIERNHVVIKDGFITIAPNYKDILMEYIKGKSI